MARTQDAIELFAVPGVRDDRNMQGERKSLTPIIQLLNTGTRVIYLDRYIFNGKIYETSGQVLPPAYGQCNHYYWIELPSHDKEVHVSLPSLPICMRQ